MDRTEALTERLAKRTEHRKCGDDDPPGFLETFISFEQIARRLFGTPFFWLVQDLRVTQILSPYNTDTELSLRILKALRDNTCVDSHHNWIC